MTRHDCPQSAWERSDHGVSRAGERGACVGFARLALAREVGTAWGPNGRQRCSPRSLLRSSALLPFVGTPWMVGNPMNLPRRCHATAKATGRPCRAFAVRGERVCRVHGAGGGRPLVHGRYSKAAAIVGEVWREEMLGRVVDILRLGENPRGDLALLEVLLDPPAQCRARSKQTGNRCRRRPTPGYRVCYYHGSRGGRPRQDGLGTLGRVQSLRKALQRQRARIQWRRLAAILDGVPVHPPASRLERENASLMKTLVASQATRRGPAGTV